MPTAANFFVIPGRAEGADPESITPVCEYGFRVRRYAAPRNDEEMWQS
jgi:hypothetical protein